MTTNFDRFKADLKSLSDRGALLYNAMQDEQYPARMEEHFQKVLKKDYQIFKKSLPPFIHSYQAWYSEAQALIKLMLPERLADFNRLYEQPKGRREIKAENYVIEDYLKNVTVTAGFDKKVVAGPEAAIPVFQQQLNIFNAIGSRFESTLFDIRLHLQAGLFDAELDSAAALFKNKHFRAAGIICGHVLEKFLVQSCETHHIKPPKKAGSIRACNDLLKDNGVYDFSMWRFIQRMEEIIKICHFNKKAEPSPNELVELVNGVDKVIKMIL